ncbi:MAG: hypothetical protein JSV33_13335 [bacterium]|nr:MAG: hypothetical protein JSV33_13335 [bacterium]
MKRNVILLIFCLMINYCGGGKVKNLQHSIPEQIGAWKVIDQDKIYNRKNIFDHINGGAELYLAYDFQHVLVRRFTGPDRNDIMLDVYDMGSSAEAFGIFSSEREDEEVGIGQGSEYGGGLLRFWQDRFFVSILSLGDEQTSKAAILELGKTVAEAISSTGPEPVLLQSLPEKGLIKERIRYMHSHIILNNHYYVASENILNLNRKTDCILAEYREDDGDSIYLLFTRYENGAQAKKAYDRFLNIYMPEAVETGYAQMENRKWTMAKLDNNTLAIVFEAPDAAGASELLSAIKFSFAL